MVIYKGVWTLKSTTPKVLLSLWQTATKPTIFFVTDLVFGVEIPLYMGVHLKSWALFNNNKVWVTISEMTAGWRTIGWYLAQVRKSVKIHSNNTRAKWFQFCLFKKSNNVNQNVFAMFKAGLHWHASEHNYSFKTFKVFPLAYCFFGRGLLIEGGRRGDLYLSLEKWEAICGESHLAVTCHLSQNGGQVDNASLVTIPRVTARRDSPQIVSCF